MSKATLIAVFFIFLITTLPVSFAMQIGLDTDEDLVITYDEFEVTSGSKNIVNWILNDDPFMSLNMPFEANGGDENVMSRDYSGHENHATVNGATWNGLEGVDSFGTYEFDGDDYLSIPDSDSLTIGLNHTISFWMRTTANTVGSYDAMYSTGSHRDTNNINIFMKTNEKISVYNYNTYSMIGGRKVLNDNVWHHILLVRENGEFRLYVDGERDGGTYHNDVIYNGDDHRLGQNPRGGTEYTGNIDELKVWTKALTEQQILQLYQNEHETINSEEITDGQTWQACAVPNDGVNDGSQFCSNTLTIGDVVVEETGSTESYTYDANGNLVTGDGYYREYNGFNQLVIIHEGNLITGRVIEEYLYNAEGIRVLTTKYSESGAINRVYTPTPELMRVVNSSGTYDYQYVYAGGRLVARLNPDGSKWFYHGDHLGSTSLVTDEGMTVVEETFYEPFGKVESGLSQETKGYTGHEHDSTGQIYMKARYYDPEKGQFVQPDTVIPNRYDPQSLNRYSYVLGNPYKYTDSDGHHPVYFAAAAVGIIAATLYWHNTPIDKENPEWGKRFLKGAGHGVNAAAHTLLIASAYFTVSGSIVRFAASNLPKQIGVSVLGTASMSTYDSLIDDTKIDSDKLTVELVVAAVTAPSGGQGGRFVSNKFISKQSAEYAYDEVVTFVTGFLANVLAERNNNSGGSEADSQMIRYNGGNPDVIKALTGDDVDARDKYTEV